MGELVNCHALFQELFFAFFKTDQFASNNSVNHVFFIVFKTLSNYTKCWERLVLGKNFN